jgi:photosystem II stability/assembly factor-like uncharacterized protein
MTEDIERELRASLARHAADAPAGDLLAERIIAAAERPPAAASRRRAWRTWTLPLVAAAAVAALVTGAVGLAHYHPSDSAAPPAAVSGSATQHPTRPAPSRTPASSAPTTSPSPAGRVDLTGVRVRDLTFAGQDDGWALGSADCMSGPGRCTALLRTTDGRTWSGIKGAAFNVPGVRNCADPCVTNLRFATDQIGYAFGPSALFITNDGGAHWSRQPGGALALETLDEDVIRVEADSSSGCPGPCGLSVATAALGSPAWHTVRLADAAAGAFLSRSHDVDYVLLTGNPAGGAGRASSTLYSSTDDGRHWTQRGEPCPQTGGEVDGTALAAGAGARIAVLCRVRQGGAQFVATSSGGAFAARGTVPASATLLAGDPRTVLAVAGSGLRVSTDGGRAWSRVPDISGSVTFAGFESTTVGRVVSDGGRTIWTTRDGGATWHEVTLP